MARQDIIPGSIAKHVFEDFGVRVRIPTAKKTVRLEIQDTFDRDVVADLLEGWEFCGSSDNFVFKFEELAQNNGRIDMIEGVNQGQEKMGLASVCGLSFVGKAICSGAVKHLRFEADILEIDADRVDYANVAIVSKQDPDLGTEEVNRD